MGQRSAATSALKSYSASAGRWRSRLLRRRERIEAHLAEHHTEFFILQCGADSIASDPLADMRFSAAAHRHATRRLIALAERQAAGRFMVFGGGGYVPNNIASAWTAVLRELTHADS